MFFLKNDERQAMYEMKLFCAHRLGNGTSDDTFGLASILTWPGEETEVFKGGNSSVAKFVRTRGEKEVR